MFICFLQPMNVSDRRLVKGGKGEPEELIIDFLLMW